MHQRSCRIIDDLEDELQQQMTEILSEQENEDNIDQVNQENASVNIQETVPDLRKGIKLPKSPLQWSSANDFFKLTFSNQPITPHDLNNIKTMVTVIYSFKTFSSINPTKTFKIPNWIPKFTSPQTQFNLDPPTYQEITNVIRKMKPSGSPCPLDQISIICFTRCPYLRSYLTEIIQAAWSCGVVPSEWKKACTILIYKKGQTNDPASFRPITLESIPLKVFTSCLRNKTFQFLLENNYIEQNIQKGFTPKLSGTLEHTAHMANIINKARTKQRSLIITLLDS